MAMDSSILAWRIPWTEEPGDLQSMGLQIVRHDQASNTHTHTETADAIEIPHLIASSILLRAFPGRKII